MHKKDPKSQKMVSQSEVDFQKFAIGYKLNSNAAQPFFKNNLVNQLNSFVEKEIV